MALPKEVFSEDILKLLPDDVFLICRANGNLGNSSWENILSCVVAAVSLGNEGAAPFNIKEFKAINLNLEKPDGTWCIVTQSPNNNVPKLMTMEQFAECYLSNTDTDFSLLFPEGKPLATSLFPYTSADDEVNNSISFVDLIRCVRKPVITDISPKIWCVGESGEVTLKGFCFDNDVALNIFGGIAGGNPVIDSYEVVNANCVIAQITVPPSAGVLEYEISANNPGGGSYVSPGIQVIGQTTIESPDIDVVTNNIDVTNSGTRFNANDGGGTITVENCFLKGKICLEWKCSDEVRMFGNLGENLNHLNYYLGCLASYFVRDENVVVSDPITNFTYGSGTHPDGVNIWHKIEVENGLASYYVDGNLFANFNVSPLKYPLYPSFGIFNGFIEEIKMTGFIGNV